MSHWVLQFARSPGGTQNHEAVAALPGGGALVASRRKNTGAATWYPNLFAVNVDGTVAWSKQLNSPATPELILAVDVATSANWLVMAHVGFGSPAGTVIQALDAATHTVQWFKRLDLTITASGSKKLAVDASGNVYVMGQKLTGGTETVLMKLNSSGVQQWCVDLDVGPGAQDPHRGSVALLSGGDVIVSCGYANVVTLHQHRVMRLAASNGDIAWSRTYDLTSGVGPLMAVDASTDSWYLVLYETQATSNTFSLVKGTAAGAETWVKSVTSGQPVGEICYTNDGPGIAADANGVYVGFYEYISATPTNPYRPGFVRVSPDGLTARYAYYTHTNGQPWPEGLDIQGNNLWLGLSNFTTLGSALARHDLTVTPATETFTSSPYTLQFRTPIVAADAQTGSTGGAVTPAAVTITEHSVAGYIDNHAQGDPTVTTTLYEPPPPTQYATMQGASFPQQFGLPVLAIQPLVVQLTPLYAPQIQHTWLSATIIQPGVTYGWMQPREPGVQFGLPAARVIAQAQGASFPQQFGTLSAARGFAMAGASFAQSFGLPAAKVVTRLAGTRFAPSFGAPTSLRVQPMVGARFEQSFGAMSAGNKVVAAMQGFHAATQFGLPAVEGGAPKFLMRSYGVVVRFGSLRLGG